MTKIGLEGAQWTNYISLLVAQSFVGFAGYFMFGGIRLLAAGKTVEFYTYEGDNHNLSGFFTTAMNRTIEFFDQYLKGD